MPEEGGRVELNGAEGGGIRVEIKCIAYAVRIKCTLRTTGVTHCFLLNKLSGNKQSDLHNANHRQNFHYTDAWQAFIIGQYR